MVASFFQIKSNIIIFQLNKEPTFQDVKNSSNRIASFVHNTPVLTNRSINSKVSGKIYFKCENFQKTGTFKMRGASNAVLSLTKEEKKYGVVTVSSGNHGAALAHAATMNKIESYVVTPKSTNPVKIQAMKQYGAELIFCDSTIESRESTFQKTQKETGATPIHPFNDYRVIAGAGTAALELLDKINELDSILVPVGGGGLISGTGIVGSHLISKFKLIGVEADIANYGRQSLLKGKIIPSDYPDTFADGLRATVGETTFPIIQKHVSEILTVSEDEIMQSMRFIWERVKIIVEPSSAVTLAAIFKYSERFSGKETGVILSGGNVDLSQIKW